MTTFDKAAYSHANAGAITEAFGRHIIRITAEQTGGRLGCFEAAVPAGEGPPPHIHEAEDEFFRVLSGTFGFWCNDDYVELETDGTICVPRGSVHRFQNIGSDEGRLMVVMTPGGFEGFFPAVAAERPVTPAEIDRIAARFHLRFVLEAQQAA